MKTYLICWSLLFLICYYGFSQETDTINSEEPIEKEGVDDALSVYSNLEEYTTFYLNYDNKIRRKKSNRPHNQIDRFSSSTFKVLNFNGEEFLPSRALLSYSEKKHFINNIEISSNQEIISADIFYPKMRIIIKEGVLEKCFFYKNGLLHSIYNFSEFIDNNEWYEHYSFLTIGYSEYKSILILLNIYPDYYCDITRRTLYYQINSLKRGNRLSLINFKRKREIGKRYKSLFD